MFRASIMVIVICSMMPFTAKAQSDEGTLGAALRAIAEDAAKVLTGKGEATATVGAFSGVGDIANMASSGPTLIRELTRELTSRKIAVQQRCKYTILGEFGEVEDKASGKQAVEIKWKIIETKNRDAVLVQSSSPEIIRAKGGTAHSYVTNQAAITVMLGLTADLPPTDNDNRRQEALKDAIDKPKVFCGAQQIKSSADSPFAMTLLTAPAKSPKAGKRGFTDYTARSPKDDSGFAFVPIKRDEVYAVQLFNDAPFEAAVELRIDGLSMYTFSDKAFRDAKDQPIYRYVIVPSKKSVLVAGWHVTNDFSDEFLVTAYAKSAAFQFGNSANVGTITACYHASWDRKTGKPPADEPKNPTQSASPADATGRGTRFDQKYIPVEYDVGVVRTTVSARYTK